MTSSLPIFVALLLYVVVCEAKLSQHEKLVRLRTEMDAKGYHAVIIPSPDEHQSEYVATHDLRREWISGFTGSAGTAVVTKAEAALWTDSRYWVQAANELDGSIWQLMKSGDPETTPMNDWIISKLASGDKVGQSAKFVSIGVWEAREKAFKKKDIHLENTDPDLIDEIWPEDERAPKPATQIKIHDLKFAGESWEQKVARVQEKLGEASADMLVVSALDEVAWLFNLRASDIPYNPMVISYAIVNRDGNNHYFYIEPARVDQQLRDHLQGVEFRPYTSVISDITEFSQEGKRIWVPATSSYAIFTAVHDPSNHAILKESPVRSMKARKSQIEIENIRKCHLRDSAARIRHWYWLDGMLASNQQVTEITSAEELEKIQQKDPLFAMPSFDAISAVGPNAAIVHYSTFFGGTNLKLEKNKIYLLDAGAQYQDCTTDITRTHHFGNPTHKQRFAYTRVLQGSIDLANIVFPPGVYGRELDVEARQWLWRTGLDYGHGTGHGIGYFLSVHEDPPSISYGGGGSNDEFLEKGMIESDEPGYYESGEFGIRLETDLETVEADTPNHFRDRTYLKFEPLTFVPFDRNLIDECALTNSQVDWLNNYYKQIDEKVKPLLEASQEKSFLEKITEEFKYSHQLPYCSRYSPSTGNDDDDNSAHILQLSKPLVALMSIFFVIYFKLFA